MKVKKGIAAAGIVLVLCAGSWYFCKPVYYRLYPFDRIRGNIQVIVDGQVCTLSEEGFKDCRRVKLQEDGSASISIKGGEYGSYEFELLTEILEQPVTFRCFQHNWWNVMDFAVVINVDTQNAYIQYSGFVTTVGDDGRKLHDEIHSEQELTEEIRLSFGL